MSKYENLDALLKAHQDNKISLSDVHSELDRFIKSFENQIEQLKKQTILAKDREIWERELCPNLVLSCQVMMGCGQEAKAFVDSQDQRHLVIIYNLLQKNTILLSQTKQLAGLTSVETQNIITKEIASINGDKNQVQNYNTTDISPVEVSFGKRST